MLVTAAVVHLIADNCRYNCTEDVLSAFDGRTRRLSLFTTTLPTREIVPEMASVYDHVPRCFLFVHMHNECIILLCKNLRNTVNIVVIKTGRSSIVRF